MMWQTVLHAVVNVVSRLKPLLNWISQKDDSEYFENDASTTSIYTEGNVGNQSLTKCHNPEVTLHKLLCGTKQYNIAGYSRVSCCADHILSSCGLN